MTFVSRNGTGTGEVSIFITTVDQIPLGSADYMAAAKPGSYGAKWTLKAAPDPSCDPTQQPCEQFLPGVYVAEVGGC